KRCLVLCDFGLCFPCTLSIVVGFLDFVSRWLVHVLLKVVSEAQFGVHSGSLLSRGSRATCNHKVLLRGLEELVCNLGDLAFHFLSQHNARFERIVFGERDNFSQGGTTGDAKRLGASCTVDHDLRSVSSLRGLKEPLYLRYVRQR